ncbi:MULTISPECIES: PaaI family thioesterase [unclassified Pseudodesulfovibrio]|uniref:PaaI family thioesterase n=1 Tax=unclassified Pseudodesulfovibrio TaxID=2661612 RepID=UPI000FEC0C83|nr:MULTISPECIES: PaaI family thioesterase [unclassified Pseudodesulfovibrio]MCJ2166102.1 PaaI family thioesterase [Pseudodesulfovibrio sp. S3-i]RWU02454.1 PaaI family thioesterase [Pseudodesulfovibrio sp. S3]
MDCDGVKKLLGEKNSFARLAGIEVVDVAPGSATCRMVIRDGHRNPFGTVNAGAIYTLAETAFGAAANSHGNVALAVNLSIAYLNPATDGTLIAKAQELSAGGRMATYSVKVFDDGGALVADVQAMGYRMKKPLEDV